MGKPASTAGIFLPPSQQRRCTSVIPSWPWMIRHDPVARQSRRWSYLHLAESAGDSLAALEQEQRLAVAGRPGVRRRIVPADTAATSSPRAWNASSAALPKYCCPMMAARMGGPLFDLVGWLMRSRGGCVEVLKIARAQAYRPSNRLHDARRRFVMLFSGMHQ